MINYFKKNINFLILSLAVIISALLYYRIFDLYFFQDDFFEIAISKASNIKEYLEFFKFRSDIVAYRPVSLQNYFFLSSSIFGLNPAGFRLVSFAFFLTSIILIFKIFSDTSGNKIIGSLTAFLWATSSIHFMSLSWVAAAYNIIGTFFWLLTSVIFVLYLNKRKLLLYVLSIATFLITVGSFEFSVAWPPIFAFYYFFVRRNSVSKTLKLFLPFIIITLIYLMLRLFLIKVPPIDEYRVALNPESAKAFFWYVLWSLNIPEEFKKQVVDNLLVFNGKFLSDYWKLVTVSFIGAITLIVLSILYPLYKISKHKISLDMRITVLALVWFSVAIFPVLLLPNHTFIMYLTLASLGTYFLASYLIVRAKLFLLIPLICAIWVSLSANTLNFYNVNSWMVEANKTARTFESDLKYFYPVIPENSVILYKLPYTWQRQPLQDQHAIRVIYNNPFLSIYYNKEALKKDLHYLKGRQVFIIPKE